MVEFEFFVEVFDPSIAFKQEIDAKRIASRRKMFADRESVSRIYHLVQRMRIFDMVFHNTIGRLSCQSQSHNSLFKIGNNYIPVLHSTGDTNFEVI